MSYPVLGSVSFKVTCYITSLQPLKSNWRITALLRTEKFSLVHQTKTSLLTHCETCLVQTREKQNKTHRRHLGLSNNHQLGIWLK